MHLVQLLLPLCDNDGRSYDHALFDQIRGELTEHFGGVTLYRRSAAEGVWRDPAGGIDNDQVIVAEVMCEKLDRRWWARYREHLAVLLAQKELVARALAIEIL
jgi:hypothetical protein